MAIANDISFTIKGDASGLVAAASRGEAAVGRLAGALGVLQGVSAKALSFTAAGVAPVLAAGYLANLAKEAVDLGDSLNKMAQKTGVGVEALSRLQYAADLSGVTAETLQKSFVGLSAAVASAASGTGNTANLFEKLGVAVRNASGQMRPSEEVLNDLADVFAEMPDGVEKTNLAVELFGKRVGPDLIPLLNSGAAGIKALGDEAERLGLVMSADFAKNAEAFNDNLERLKSESKAAGIAIAGDLLPPLNRLLEQYLDTKRAGLSFIDALLGIGLSNPFKAAGDQIDDLTKKLAALREARERAMTSNATQNAGIDVGAIEAQIKTTQGLLDYYRAQQKRGEVESAEDVSAKLTAIAQQRTRKMAELDQLRGIVSGKINADILKDDGARTEAQIANAQKLKDALQKAWEATRAEARKAGEEAAQLFEKAADVRKSGQEKADDRRAKALTPEEADAKAVGAFQSAAADASFFAAAAESARLDGRAEVARINAERAAKAAEAAVRAAEKIQDDNIAAGLIEQGADLQARVVESQARQKQTEATRLEETAAAQRQSLAELEQQITALQEKARGIQFGADISQATGELSRLDQQVEALRQKLAENPLVISLATSGAAVGSATDAIPARAYGGPLPGYAPHDRADNMLYWGTPGEWVMQLPAVRYYGADFMRRLNAMQLPRYADGGALSRLRIPALPAPASRASTPTPVNLHLDGRRYPMSAAPDVVAEMTAALGREALKRGARR